MRPVIRVVTVTLAGLAACLDSTDPSRSGGLSFHMPASPAALDSGHIVLTGPTTKTVKVVPPATVTIDGLSPGTYTVALEGFVGGGVGYFTQVTGVSVAAGKNTTATAPAFRSFQTAILSMPTYTVDGQFDMVFSKVQDAASYVVQRDASPSFTNPLETTVSDTTVNVSIPLTGPYNVRVLAVDPYGTRGQASAPRAVTTVTTVTVSPGSATIDPGTTQQFSAVAKDAQGNTVTVLFFWASSNQNVALVDETGLATGVAGGTAKITALGLGLPGSATLTVASAAAAKVAFTVQPSSATAGAAISPAVKVEIQDARGNRVSGAANAVTVAIGGNPGGATLTGTRTVNASDGVASFSDLSLNKAGAAYTLVASSGALTPATSGLFDINPGTAAQLGFIAQPTSGEPNLALPAIQVAVQDAFGNNTVPSAINLVSVALGTNPTGATLSGTAIVLPVNGVATFDDLVINKTGEGYTLQATAAGLTGATSASIDIFLHFVSISGGGSFNDALAGQATHTCGLTAAGVAYCWGLGASGQLGNGTDTSSSMPVLVSGGHKFTSIAAGLNHTCGVRADSTALCWGLDDFGQLGNDLPLASSNVPVLVVGTNRFTSVTAGAHHSCGLRADKAVLCWGRDDQGQLGNDAAFAGSPVPEVVAGSPGTYAFTSVDAGRWHTCGVTTTGAALCWGWDSYGQLGDGGPGGGAGGQSGLPVVVAGSTAPGGGLASVGAGSFHTCGLRAADRRALCWGHNGNGQLGTGGGDVTSPAPVRGGLTFASLNVGARHTCSITTDGLAACWGLNNYGQLGNGTTNGAGEPVFVTGGLEFLSVSAGEAHTCGLTANGAYCWGRNDLGQLGNGTNVNYAVPIRVAGSR